MNATPGLGAFNKDKVANKFGIQLKKKDTNQQSPRPSINLTNEQTTIITDNQNTPTVTKNKTVSDFRLQDKTNGFQLKTNISKTPEPLRKNLENTPKRQSHGELLSTPININQRRDSLNSNVSHSTSINTEKSNTELSSSPKSPSTITIPNLFTRDRSKSPEPSSTSRRISITQTPPPTTNELSLSPIPKSPDLATRISNLYATKDRSKSPEPSSISRRASMTKVTTEQPFLSAPKSPDTTPRTTSNLISKDRSKSPEPSSIKQPTTTTSEQPLLSTLSSKQATIPSTTTTTTKTEAEIEYQKDQPLYKRQLSKTLDNASSLANKTKHQHEHSTLSNTR